jgi:hypothetical protein
MTHPTLQRIRDQLISAFVAERSKVIYVPVTKAGSTSMLRILADLEGYDVTRYLHLPELVHNQGSYPLPLLSTLGDTEQLELLEDPAWLKLTVVRNPYQRLYSAWEDKLFIGRFGWDRMEPPPLVLHRGGIDVGASYRAFVADLDRRSEVWMADPHFCTQAQLARPETIPYDQIASTAELGELISQLEERAERRADTTRVNEGLGLPAQGFLDDEAVEIITRHYAVDFDLSRSTPERPNKKVAKVILDPVATNLRSHMLSRYQRISEQLWWARQKAGMAPPGDAMPRG